MSCRIVYSYVIVLDQLAVSNNLVPEHIIISSQRHTLDRTLETSNVTCIFNYQDMNFSTKKKNRYAKFKYEILENFSLALINKWWKIVHALLLNTQSDSHNVSNILKARIMAGLTQTKNTYSVATYLRLKRWVVTIASSLQEPTLLKEWKLHQWYQSKHEVIPAS